MSDTAWGVYDYPEPPPEPPVPECGLCGFDLSDHVYEYADTIVCRACYAERKVDDIGWEGIADACGDRHMSFADYLEEYLNEYL